MTYNASNRKHIRTAEKAQVVVKIIDREVICGLMSVRNGRHWVYDRLAQAQVFTDPFSSDPYIHAYNAGRRAEGINLLNDLVTYTPDNFNLMMQEADERRITDERRRQSPAPATAGPDGDAPGDPDTADQYDEFGRFIDTSVPEAEPSQQG